MFYEDVFYLYERNKLIYSDFCFRETVQPITIGETCVPCKMNIKCYIRQGEECPICLEKIMLKKDAFLTGCGHAFHRKCLFKTFESRWKAKPYSALRCPLCRCGLGAPTLLTRYVNSINMKKKHDYIDQLENFWITKDFMMPHFCDNIKKSHYLGMNKNCYKCTDYQKFG
jgi:hypothetical protein